MPNILEVQIVGDISSLEKSLNDAKKLQAEYTASIEKTSSELKENISVTNGYKKAIEQLNSEYKSGSISQKDFQKQLANLKRDEKEASVATADLRKELANLKKEQKDLGGGFDSVAKKTANGGNALMQFSRIAQDAPFGIMGIGNNITATVEAFGHLQKSTGSTGGALKALASSMLGSGGILLAVSLVTTGLTYMSQNGLSVGDVFRKLTGDFGGYADQLKKVNEAVYSDSGVQDAISNVNELTINIGLAKDGFLSKEQVVKQYNETIGKTTGLVSSLDEAERELVKNGDAYIKMTLYKAAAQIALEKAAENALKAEESRRKKLDEFSNAFLDADLTQTRSAEQYALKQQALKDQLQKRKAEEVAINKKASDDNLSIAKKFQSDAAKIAKDFNFNLFGDTEAPKKEKTKKVLERDTVIPFKTSLKPELDVEKTTSALLEVKNEYGKLQEKLIKFDEPVPVDVKIKPNANPNLVKNLPLLDELASKYKDLSGEDLVLPDFSNSSSDEIDNYVNSLDRALQAATLFSNGTSSAIGALAGNLTTSLETGNAALDAFVGSVIQGFAEIAIAQITGLIAQQAVATASIATNAAVSTGNAVTAATSTAAATGPAAAFVLPALVGAAIGFIAAAFSGIKFAHGGIVPGGSFTGDKIPAMLNSGEAVMNQQQQANTLMAIANGNSNSLQSNRKSSTFNIETKLRGSDILLALKREEKSR